MRRRLPQLLILAGALVAMILAAGCRSMSDTALRDSVKALDTPLVVLPPASQSSSNARCSNPTASLRPRGVLPAPGRMPVGSLMRTIQERGRLVGGVDQNTLFFGYLDPFNGRLQGFELDLLRQIAKAILGKPHVEFKVLTTTDQRTQLVEDSSVDIVADAVTINCQRLREVSFSTVYYDASQRLLVPTDSHARGVQDLGGKRVCARARTTSLEKIKKQPSHPIPYPVEQRTDCLVALQEGLVDAITGDDVILRGFQAQDPYTKLLPGRLEDEPYGLVIAKTHPEFVRFVNGVLEGMRADGTLAALYRKWLGASAPRVPHALYRD